MDQLEQFRQRLETERPVDWDEMPDIALYMDQVISYMPRQIIRLDQTEQITAAMVNNYIKDGVVPRADGKRYGREHIGFLTAVCTMKKVLSVSQIKTLFDAVPDGSDPQTLYGYFTAGLDRALKETAVSLELKDDETLARLALGLALRSYADQLACQQILACLKEQEETVEQEEKERKEQQEKEKKEREKKEKERKEQQEKEKKEQEKKEQKEKKEKEKQEKKEQK